MAEGEKHPPEDTEYPGLPPDEAFSVLGNETRIKILQELGNSTDPRSFTDLRNSVGIQQGSQFNYHLDKLVGHFVQKTDVGYALREPGRRVIQAILSGAVTADPTRDHEEIDFDCLHCGAPVTVRYARGKVRLSCPVCGGNFDETEHPPHDEADIDREVGNLSNLTLPPAGVQDRDAYDMFRAAGTLAHLDALAATADVCPRCAAPIEFTIASVCDDHDATDGLCETCDHRHRVRIRFACTNCIFERTTSAVMGLLDIPEVMCFAAEHGLDTTGHGIEWGWHYDETINTTDPYTFTFTFHIDEDSLAVTVDDAFNVIETTTE